MIGRRYLSAVLLAGALLLLHFTPVFADGSIVGDRDDELARRYVPVFYFHPDEVFRPQPVDVILQNARLRQSRRLWFDVNVLLSLDPLDLWQIDTDPTFFLDVWYGDDGRSAFTNYTSHQTYYQQTLSPHAGGPPPTVYARVVRDEPFGTITVQYWALYFYNDWFNKHEGDWEMVQVILRGDEHPEWVIFSQHHGGTRRPWRSVSVEDDTHPVVYVAKGSHANYFIGDETYPNGLNVGTRRVEIMDRTGSADRTMPDVILLVDRETYLVEPDAWPGSEWISFGGRWGETAPQADFGGPLGPADKGLQWDSPYEWAMRQPLDTDVWYENRLRVAVNGPRDRDIRIRLTDEYGQNLAGAEELGNLAILHRDPPPGTVILAHIETRDAGISNLFPEWPDESGLPLCRYGECALGAWTVEATWPDADREQVTHMSFQDVPLDDFGGATLILDPNDSHSLQLGQFAVRAAIALEASELQITRAAWDAPELVWIGGMLPAHQVATGLLTAVLAGVLPALLYVAYIYWVDRYEREPKRLLATAFVWGALPAVLVALLVELFFDLPPDLIGAQALEALRLGMLVPLLQEVLKGSVVVLIARRYRLEFDDVLDGIVYGAVVGVGFAMTGNVISNLGSFALWGFAGLNGMAMAEGVVHSLNHAMYTAVFGASLGYTQWHAKREDHRLVPVAGFMIAVLFNALHNLLLRLLIGLTMWTVLVTGLGLVAMIVLALSALSRQHRCLEQELRGEIADELYRSVLAPGAVVRLMWATFRTHGLKGAWRARRLRQLCAELALKKAQRRAHPDKVALHRTIESLREQIEEVASRIR
ncbi:MAG: PrsW family intramembrane metalloprotease [Chloroflexi bacterium]|nr:PrsW family intramembrane metalloprotease [Chloroflexota bacterium]